MITCERCVLYDVLKIIQLFSLIVIKDENTL